MTTDAVATLSVIGALAVNWLNTTHSSELGHDHHCANFADGLEPGDPETCTCGWATFYQAYLDVTNAK